MDHEIATEIPTDEPEATRSVPRRGFTDRAASLVEYALLLALIAVVCILALTALGEAASDSYSNSTERVRQA